MMDWYKTKIMACIFVAVLAAGNMIHTAFAQKAVRVKPEAIGSKQDIEVRFVTFGYSYNAETNQYLVSEVRIGVSEGEIIDKAFVTRASADYTIPEAEISTAFETIAGAVKQGALDHYLNKAGIKVADAPIEAAKARPTTTTVTMPKMTEMTLPPR